MEQHFSLYILELYCAGELLFNNAIIFIQLPSQLCSITSFCCMYEGVFCQHLNVMFKCKHMQIYVQVRELFPQNKSKEGRNLTVQQKTLYGRGILGCERVILGKYYKPIHLRLFKVELTKHQKMVCRVKLVQCRALAEMGKQSFSILKFNDFGGVR